MYKNFQNRPYQASYKRRQYLNRQFHKNPPAEHKIINGILGGLGNLIFAPFRKKRVSTSERKIIIDRWYRIRKLITAGDEASLKSAVIEADKLMDFGLKSARFSGNKFADRIRAAKSFYPKKIYSGIWESHILRNELVHNINNKINSYQAKDAVKKVGEGLRRIKGL